MVMVWLSAAVKVCMCSWTVDGCGCGGGDDDDDEGGGFGVWGIFGVVVEKEKWREPDRM